MAWGAICLLALILFIGGQALGGVVFLVLAFLVSPFGIPAIADWLMDRLYSLKYSLQSFISGARRKGGTLAVPLFCVSPLDTGEAECVVFIP